MELVREWVTFAREDGAQVAAYLSRPARWAQPGPAVLVIQEVWGPDAHIQDVADRLATAGYVALAVDLYSAGGRPPALAQGRIEEVKAFLDELPPAAWQDSARREEELARRPEDQAQRIRETMGLLFGGARDLEGYLASLRGAMAYLRRSPLCGPDAPIGSVGFCLGGALSARLACRAPDLRAAVVYYGQAPEAEDVPHASCPILGHYGGDDPRVTEGVGPFAEAMRRAGKAFAYHIYLGAPHAFFNDTRPSYRIEAARVSWARTLAFLAAQLG